MKRKNKVRQGRQRRTQLQRQHYVSPLLDELKALSGEIVEQALSKEGDLDPYSPEAQGRWVAAIRIRELDIRIHESQERTKRIQFIVSKVTITGASVIGAIYMHETLETLVAGLLQLAQQAIAL